MESHPDPISPAEDCRGPFDPDSQSGGQRSVYWVSHHPDFIPFQRGWGGARACDAVLVGVAVLGWGRPRGVSPPPGGEGRLLKGDSWWLRVSGHLPHGGWG